MNALQKDGIRYLYNLWQRQVLFLDASEIFGNKLTYLHNAKDKTVEYRLFVGLVIAASRGSGNALMWAFPPSYMVMEKYESNVGGLDSAKNTIETYAMYMHNWGKMIRSMMH